MSKDYDVLIVGARVAGSSLAIRLAKLGKRVLLIDKAEFPSDTVSTHFMNPRGMTYLKDLGVIEEIQKELPLARNLNVDIHGIEVGGEIDTKALQRKLQQLHGRDFQVLGDFACIRRTFLDQLLIDRALALGVEFQSGLSLVSLSEDRKTATFKSYTGATLDFSAELIVGADGRNSRCAQLLNLGFREYRDVNTYAVYTYIQGLKPRFRIAKKNRLAVGIAATNNNETMVLVYGPSSFYSGFQQDKIKNFFRHLEYVDPEFAAEVRACSAEQALQLRSTVNIPSFIRERSPELPLIGDAACFKDQVTASGMMHALRDSTLLAETLESYYAGHVTLSEALDVFESKRYVDTLKFFDFTCQQAEMNPPKPEDIETYKNMSLSVEARSAFVSLYTDVIGHKTFLETVSKTILKTKRQNYTQSFYQENYENPFLDSKMDLEAFSRSTLDFSQLSETSFVDRAKHYGDFVKSRLNTNTFQYERTLLSRPSNKTELMDENHRIVKGVNFASQDYLALAQSAEIKEAALRALRDFGPHSAGSPMVIGNTKISRDLENEMRKLTGKKHVLLYPTGYAAGMGAVLGMVRPYDHIVMDRLTHACLQQGSYAATKNVHKFSHLDAEAARYVLQSVRKKDKRGAILLITEGVFSMDADSPDLARFQELAKEFDATLLVDVAHDLGAMGPQGRGALGIQNFYGKADVVMGSFSKTFATNGGFVASDSEELVAYLKMYSTPFMFSNALSPLSSAVALEAARIVQSKEGDLRREKLLSVVNALRSDLQSHSHKVLGAPCAIVPVLIGTEAEARLAHKLTAEKNMAAMILEYPVVPLGATRYRLQVMASHTLDDAKKAAAIINQVMFELKHGMFRNFNRKEKFNENLYKNTSIYSRVV